MTYGITLKSRDVQHGARSHELEGEFRRVTYSRGKYRTNWR